MRQIPPLPDIETAISIPSNQWAGNCYSISCAIVKSGIITGNAVYGHFSGHIHPQSYFGSRSGGVFVQHGWIVQDDGYVIDPTRFAFEFRDPYIWHAHPDDEDARLCKCCWHYGSLHARGCDECRSTGEFCDYFIPEHWPYDEGGNKFRQGWFRPSPAVNADDKRFTLNLTDDVAEFVAAKLGQDFGKPLTMSQICWVANLSYIDIYNALGINGTYQLYKAIADLDGSSIAFIPMDNRIKVERESGKFLENR